MTPIFQFLGGSSLWKITSRLSILLLLLSLTMSHWPWMKEIPNVLKLMFSLHCCHKWMDFQTEIIQGKLLSEQNHILQEKMSCHYLLVWPMHRCLGNRVYYKEVWCAFDRYCSKNTIEKCCLVNTKQLLVRETTEGMTFPSNALLQN